MILKQILGVVLIVFGIALIIYFSKKHQEKVYTIHSKYQDWSTVIFLIILGIIFLVFN